MKIRQGFVSNSSSSSFIVEMAFDTELGDYTFLKPKKHKFLVKNGFKVEKDIGRYTHECICNQDYVIEDLIKNGISFFANTHYDHESVTYDAETDKLYEAKNYGEILKMYGPSAVSKEHLTVKTGKEFIKQNI